jgi:hypothetical protein
MCYNTSQENGPEEVFGMANRPKQIGTRAETIVLKVCQRNGFPYARRNALQGAKDCGDIHLGDGTDTIIEVKGGKQCQKLTPAKMDLWMKQTRAEIVNAGARFGFLVTQVAGYGEKSAEKWLAHIPAELTGTHWDHEVNYVTTDLETALAAVNGVINGDV